MRFVFQADNAETDVPKTFSLSTFLSHVAFYARNWSSQVCVAPASRIRRREFFLKPSVISVQHYIGATLASRATEPCHPLPDAKRQLA